jgi:hypothetical protein
MTVSLDQLLYGIRKVESGGNYNVVNSIGAVGAYQVMKANIPSWTKRALGHSLTWQQFRASKSAQDAVARTILGGYYKKYGAEGAASMWFSGQPNPGSSASDGGNTVYQYVAKVMAASGGGSVGGLSGSSYQVPAVTAKLDKYELMEQYGLTADIINHNGDIKKLFNQAVAGGWDATLFTAKLKNTKWWKTTSDSARKYFMLRFGDPATYKAKAQASAVALNQLAVQVGLGSQISGSKNSAILNKAIGYQMRDGWTDARIKAYFGTMVTMHGQGTGEMYGEAGEAYDQVFQLAYANGQSYSRNWYQTNIRNVVAGRTTIEALQADIRNKAASKYYAFASQIRAGQTVLDLAQPYISAVSQILELPSTDIDLNNKYVSKAMTTKVAAGQQPGTQYPIWKFENDLRSDPLWKKTNNARESMFSVAHQVAKDWGLSY